MTSRNGFLLKSMFSRNRIKWVLTTFRGKLIRQMLGSYIYCAVVHSKVLDFSNTAFYSCSLCWRKAYGLANQVKFIENISNSYQYQLIHVFVVTCNIPCFVVETYLNVSVVTLSSRLNRIHKMAEWTNYNFVSIQSVQKSIPEGINLL